MKMPHERIQDTIGFLGDQLERGWSYFQCAKSLHKADQANKLSSARYFFITVYQACLHEAVLVLSKLVIAHKDSITVFYLLDQAENNPHLFSHTTHENVDMFVKKHKELLGNYGSLIDSVRNQRDRVIAHLDRKHINDPSTISNLPVNMVEVEKCFQDILEIINVYKKYYDNSEFCLAHAQQNIERDISFLTELIKTANRQNLPAA
ncbi:MAG: hypothetical protein DRP09_19475 [Candidatus Thorarchaeota archaeon]|nr:MAG: hypothetical protein DRP09_19475 [Candidatus Thorarchaeota archaeon]